MAFQKQEDFAVDRERAADFGEDSNLRQFGKPAEDHSAQEGWSW